MSRRKYFGTDGVRGCFGQEPITPTTIMKLGWAVGTVLQEENSSQRRKVIIGKDTRISGYLLESALEAGLSSAGVDISLLGPMPTPGIAYLTRTARASAGIVISASHNSYQDNGIKFFSPEGEKLPDSMEQLIETRLDQPMTSVSSRELGKAERFPDAAGRYIEFCKSTIPHRVSFKGMKVVVDCANGAAYHIAPDVFHELGADVVAIANSPDGFNINDACGSTHPEQLQKEVMRQQADIGIALDGDGDRVLMVDGSGNCVDGDQILYVMARTRRQSNRLYGGVMGTLMSNLGLEKACEHMRIPFKRSAVGDRYVLQGLRENHWTLGGETSGHIICLDKSTTGDGIIAALEVVHAMVQSATSLADLCSGMHRYPQQMINVTVANGSSEFRHYINDDASVCAAIADAESRLAGNGRVVLRPSGTEPVIRVMVEGDDALEVDHISQELAEVVKIAARS